ncbi:MAG: hypothetical protein M3436_15230 [Pseudomonadota bacterium]|nr:hypothetical protein [Pseudomonadota bacterium]
MSRDLVEVGLGWSWTPDRVSRSIQCPDTVVLSAHDGPRVTVPVTWQARRLALQISSWKG